MEYHKYLKYKTKYLQLKQKIKREENNENSNMILYTGSPLQHMRLQTYENEQEGGFTFKTGFYAFFCKSSNFEGYKKNSDAPTLSEIRTLLGYKGYSFKLFTERTLNIRIANFGKKEGTKFNLVTPTIFDSKTPNFIDEDRIDTETKLSEISDSDESLNLSIGLAVMLGLIITMPIGLAYRLFQAAKHIVFFIIMVGSIGQFNPWDKYKTFKEKMAGLSKKEKLISYFKTIFILAEQQKPNGYNYQIIEKNKIDDVYLDIINNVIVKNFLIESIKHLSTKSFFNIPDAYNDLQNKVEPMESSGITFTEIELNEIKKSNKLIKDKVDRYNEDNKIDCCIIIEINVGKNKFLERYNMKGEPF
jgi:hypothetical protein